MSVFSRGDIVIRDFQSSDINAIHNNVRDIDRKDIRALFNMTPEKSIWYSARVSTYVFTISSHGKAVAILGLLPETLLSDNALIWMVTSNSIHEVPLGFLRASKPFVNHLFKLYRSFYGIVRNENICSLNWIRWLGAQMKDNGSFHSFILEKN